LNARRQKNGKNERESNRDGTQAGAQTAPSIRSSMKTKTPSLPSNRHSTLAVTFAAMLLVSGCSESNTESSAEVQPIAVAKTAGLPNKAKPLPTAVGRFTAAVDSVNYSHIYEFSYTLYDLSRNPPQAIGGDLTDVLQGGGSKGCCVSLPTQWHPGIKLKLDWERADFTKIEKFSQEFELPKYDRPGDVFVILNPDSTIEVIVSAVEPGHPDWPGKIKLPPWDQCVKDYGRKTCKQALPNYGGASPREMQGFCTYLKDENDDLTLCDKAMRRCVQDYEDEDFCQRTLWGKRKAQS